jgi:uncharacterized protein (TIGR02444 family)
VSLWDWALEAYARPGVQEVCVRLQDSHGQCVPYLLWAAWAAADGQVLSAATLSRGAALARAWEAEAIGPLRQIRRRLKTPRAGVAESAREAVRAQVKAAELAAERALMDALEALSPQGRERTKPLADALADAAGAWGAAPPLQALRDLAENLA